MDLKFLLALDNKKYLEKLLVLASKRTSFLYRTFFADDLIKLVHSASNDYKSNFEDVLPAGCSFWILLGSGKIGTLQGLLHSVDFSSNGRGVASLAFFVHILNCLDEFLFFSKTFNLEVLVNTLWPTIHCALNQQRVNVLQGAMNQLTETPVPSIESLISPESSGSENESDPVAELEEGSLETE
ncbi:E1B 19K [Bottlenose dolphin adenovirus 1]|uniref:E1B protein, small T-antigen n=1 Tax=Bottlenose dolphin adenovirus 1 TaxID=1714377 RepID=A0A1X7MN46_9ADEN|nr:E1B 19K [Bottlenose dolphin adenovirus 1]SMG83436.1 E1B 19K [Bottlenose dolphin adenovirus 1]